MEAQCKFDDVSGSGIIKLIFKENSIIEANIEFTNKEYIDKEYLMVIIYFIHIQFQI